MNADITTKRQAGMTLMELFLVVLPVEVDVALRKGDGNALLVELIVNRGVQFVDC